MPFRGTQERTPILFLRGQQSTHFLFLGPRVEKPAFAAFESQKPAEGFPSPSPNYRQFQGCQMREKTLGLPGSASGRGAPLGGGPAGQEFRDPGLGSPCLSIPLCFSSYQPTP